MGADAVLEAATVRLRPVKVSDLPLLVRWANDRDVRHWLHRSERPPSTLESERERLRDRTWAEWCIEAADGRAIGLVRLRGIEDSQGCAELAIVIGEKGCWGRGYGTDAIRLVLRHAFGELGLRRVWLITDADNLRGQRCFQKCGFVPEALLRGHRLRYGQPLDMIAMGVLRDDWAPLRSEGGD